MSRKDRIMRAQSATAIHLNVAITTAKYECGGPALDGALAGIAVAFGLPEAEVFKLAGVCEVHGAMMNDDCPHFLPEDGA
jgi:hypothetical protein